MKTTKLFFRKGRLKPSVVRKPLGIRLSNAFPIGIRIYQLQALYWSEDHAAGESIGRPRTHLNSPFTTRFCIGLPHFALLHRVAHGAALLRIEHAQREPHGVIAILTGFCRECAPVGLLHHLRLLKPLFQPTNASSSAAFLSFQVGLRQRLDNLGLIWLLPLPKLGPQLIVKLPPHGRGPLPSALNIHVIRPRRERQLPRHRLDRLHLQIIRGRGNQRTLHQIPRVLGAHLRGHSTAGRRCGFMFPDELEVARGYFCEFGESSRGGEELRGEGGSNKGADGGRPALHSRFDEGGEFGLDGFEFVEI
mmetsp:Transcript_32000/g.59169  ORF Transcript_32000/g.59169 Transcript_32000/m.59169 type:complete len:306 (+) Transcript_32000:177-1094(+)